MQVIKIDGHEADDVIATLVEQVLQLGYQAVIASPDKDFKQLLSEDVQIVMPLDDLERWSFYTLKHYMAQYNCDPCCDLSLSKSKINMVILHSYYVLILFPYTYYLINVMIVCRIMRCRDLVHEHCLHRCYFG